MNWRINIKRNVKNRGRVRFERPYLKADAMSDPFRFFPYKPRRFQLEAVRSIHRALRQWHVCLHAPTGFGKTPVILASLIPYIRQGYKVIWAVRTGNETDRPIEELKVIAERTGLDLFGLSYRGKRDMCPLAQKYGEMDHSDVTYLCRTERRRCPYYRAFRENFEPEMFTSGGPLTYSEVYELAVAENMCPYFVQRELLHYVDVVALSYNYVVDSRLEWSVKGLIDFKESFLVVDEAHNLQRIELGSDVITTGTIERALKECDEVGCDEGVVGLLVRVADEAKRYLENLDEEEDVEFRVDDFVRGEDEPKLEVALKLGERVRRERLREGKRPRSSLYRFSVFWLNALELEGMRGIAFIAEKERETLRLNIWDMRAAEILSQRWRRFKRCIFTSGTLKPIKAFAEVVGLRRYIAMSVPNIYNPENVKVYVVEGLSTRGEELSPEIAEKYVQTIVNFRCRVNVNTAVFTASYRVQNELIKKGLKNRLESLGLEVFVERKNMRGQESRKMLEAFKNSQGRGVLIAPMGGRFAEGADFPGEQLQAIFLAGIPFEKPTTRTRLYLDYYKELYGEEKGTLYGYILPALRRASQALGRAIRSPEDKAVFALGDERYIKYASLMPDYVKDWGIKIKHAEISKIETPW